MQTNQQQQYVQPQVYSTPQNVQVQGQRVNIQPVVSASPIQQVVVTPDGNLVHNSPLPIAYYTKQTPCTFWIFLICGIIEILGGVEELANGRTSDFIGTLFTFGIWIILAYSSRFLEVKGFHDYLYIGYGPLKWFSCCFQKVDLYHSEIESYYTRKNKWYYPLGWFPGKWSVTGDDCCTNFCFRGWCCCTNTMFYNAACVCCCQVSYSPYLTVFKLKRPLSCCCHTFDYVAVSTEYPDILSNYLSRKGLRCDGNDNYVGQQLRVNNQQQGSLMSNQQQIGMNQQELINVDQGTGDGL